MRVALRIVLIVAGLLTLLPSVLGVVWPTDKLAAWGQEYLNMTLAPGADTAFTVYLFKAASMTWAWAGVLLLLAAANPAKYLVLIRTLALAAIFIGISCILVGAKVGLPTWVYLGDGLSCLIGGVLIWTLSTAIGQECKPSVTSAEPTD